MNSDFELRDVSSIKVNAAAGKVAVGSKRKGAIYIADVAEGATFKKYDVSGFDSYGEADMVLTATHVLYIDAAGYANIRLLDLATGSVHRPDLNQFGAGWGPVGASNGKTFAWAIKDPRNAWVIGDLGGEAQILPNTGTKSELGSYGKLGSGRSMAMASDGTAFIAGTRSILESNCLQVTQNGAWKMVTSSDGKPIPATDVVAGNSMIVFKTGKPSTSSEVQLGYATFGSSVTVESTDTPNITPQESTDAKPANKETPQDKQAMEIRNDIERELLSNSTETEKTIFEALEPAVGEKAARKQARDTVINGLKASGHAHLIEVYKKRWKK